MSSITNLLLLLCSSIASVSSFPVEVLVCTEALCPDSKQFVQTQLVPVFSQLGPEVMDLQLVPFGNAHLKSDGAVECQHGVGECDANVYELCAIHMNPNPKEYLPFVDCLYNVLPMGGQHEEPLDKHIFQNCTGNLWWSGIHACRAIPGAVRKLIQAADAATPDNHKGVPWIEIDGNHMDEGQLDFKTEICKAFVAKGGSHPACSAVLLEDS
jgi:interferon gamma-inducible protein 30